MGNIRSIESPEAPMAKKRLRASSRDFVLALSNYDPGIPQEMLDKRPRLTGHQVKLVESTWYQLQVDISRVGVVMFMELFETHPDVRDAFMPFRGLTNDGLRDSKWLRAHALRVMGIVEKVLARIHDEEKLVKLLHELGRKHVSFNAKTDYIDLIGPQFIHAIQPALKDHWTPEVEEAWSDLFKLIGHLMKEAMTL